MKENQVAHALRQIAKQGVPNNMDLWPAIKARLQPRRHPSRWERLVPNTHLGWAFLSLALILAFGAAAYAVSPAVARLFEQEPGLEYVAQAELFQEFDLSQTLDGITVTLERAYADGNRIVIGFTLQTPGNRQYEARHLTLTDAAGNVFRRTVGFGAAGQSDLYEISLPPGKGAYVFAFDAAAVVGMPEELDLRLAMELEELVLPPDAEEEKVLSLHTAPHPPPPEQASPAEPEVVERIVGYVRDSPDEPQQPIVVELQPLPAGAIVGPFAFDFSVPFVPGRTIEVQQKVEAAGVAITLQKVVIAPSETQATLCLVTPDRSKEWLLIAEDGGDRYGGTTSALGERGAECHRLIYSGARAGRFGRATLTVTELVGFDPAGQGEQTRLVGPWVFHFQVP